jgi:uncharacterized protein (DUF2141 family)
MRVFKSIFWLLVTGYWLLVTGFWLLAPGELKITVTNISPTGGDLYIAVYDKEESYMNPDLAFLLKIVPIDSETENIVFKDVPPGEYAISIFQDINGNGELDKRGAGVPKEPFGFSNDARGKLGPAKYKDAKFSFSSDIVLNIKLVNNIDK